MKKGREVVAAFVGQTGPACIVASLALVALLAVAFVAIRALPSTPPQARNGASIVAIATAAFGVLGATVGGFFAIKTATDAVSQRGARTRAANKEPASGNVSRSR